MHPKKFKAIIANIENSCVSFVNFHNHKESGQTRTEMILSFFKSIGSKSLYLYELDSFLLLSLDNDDDKARTAIVTVDLTAAALCCLARIPVCFDNVAMDCCIIILTRILFITDANDFYSSWCWYDRMLWSI